MIFRLSRFAGIEHVVGKLDHRHGHVGAVVAHTLEVGEQVVEAGAFLCCSHNLGRFTGSEGFCDDSSFSVLLPETADQPCPEQALNQPVSPDFQACARVIQAANPCGIHEQSSVSFQESLRGGQDRQQQEIDRAENQQVSAGVGVIRVGVELHADEAGKTCDGGSEPADVHAQDQRPGIACKA